LRDTDDRRNRVKETRLRPLGPEGPATAERDGSWLILQSQIYRLEDFRRSNAPPTQATFFTRNELDSLLSLYSRRVASGEWRDYALDHRQGLAVFSIFRNSRERPLFAVAKRLKAGERSGEYLLFSGRERLARGQSLREVLKAFEHSLQVVS
jgi:hypothetical protein